MEPEIAQVLPLLRNHAGRLAAALVPLVGDFAAAKDLVQDAVEAVLHPLAERGHPRATGRVAVHGGPPARP